MTIDQVVDYLANECGNIPYFESLDNEEDGVFYVSDGEGNMFKVKVTKEV